MTNIYARQPQTDWHEIKIHEFKIVLNSFFKYKKQKKFYFDFSFTAVFNLTKINNEI